MTEQQTAPQVNIPADQVIDELARDLTRTLVESAQLRVAMRKQDEELRYLRSLQQQTAETTGAG